MAELWLGLGHNRENNRFGKAFVRIRAKTEKITLFNRALVRIVVEIEKTSLWQGLG